MSPKHKILFSFLALLMLGHALSGTAKADAVTFVTINTNSSGGPVSASARITQTGSLITVQLTNNTPNINNVGQAISGFQFKIAGASLAATPNFTGSGRLVEFSTTTYSTTAVEMGTNGAGADPINGWGLTTPSINTFYLNGLGVADPNYPGKQVPPDETILGPPDAGYTTARYSSANSSINPNAPHNPFVVQTATFSFTVTGLNGPAMFSNFTFLFGTGPQSIPCTTNICTQQTPTPEPAALLLLGSGLTGMAAFMRRRRRKHT